MAQIGRSEKRRRSLVGKIKTTSQMIAIPLLLYDDLIGKFDPHVIGTWLIYVAAVLTLISMAMISKMALPQFNKRL